MTPTNTSLNTATPTATATADAITDWGSSFIVYYSCSEAANATRVNRSNTSLGTPAGDLDTANTVAQNTTNFFDTVATGSSCDFDGTTENLSAPFADVGAALNIATSATWGCWGRMDADANSTALAFAGPPGGSTMAYRMARQAPNDQVFCTVVESGGSEVNNFSAFNEWPINTDIFAACRFNDTTNQLGSWIRGNTVVGAFPTNMRSVASGSLIIGAASTTGDEPWSGELDACFVTSRTLTDAQICRLCSCGLVTADKGCSCITGTPASYANAGVNTTALCNSCTLPACNAAAP